MSDLVTGSVFGNLTVISRDDDRIYLDGKKEEMYKCQCKCRNKTIVSVPRDYLEKGLVTDCGCKISGSFEDLTGQKFGNLTVLGRADKDYTDSSGKRQIQWNCRCDCGKELVVRGNSLKSGHTRSCGCLHGKINITHGDSKTRLYKKWQRIKDSYGVCKEWEEDYTVFKDWALRNGYSDEGDDLQFHPKNKDLPLSPSNCELLTNKEARNNSEFNVNITYDGKTMSLTGWSEATGIPLSTIRKRLNSGWDPEKILTTPPNANVKTVEYDGKEYTLSELSSICGISRDVLYDRIIKGGWGVNEAMTTPMHTAKYNIEHNGDIFNSTQWDRIMGYPKSTIASRIKAGYTFAEALAGKPEARRKLPKNVIYFVKDGIGYSQDEWTEKFEKGRDN